MLFDTHAHLNDEKFDENRSELILSLAPNGVSNYCEIGYDIPSSKKAVRLAQEYDFIYAACGVHPHDTDSLAEDDMQSLKVMMDNKKAVAIGEIGLDYYYDNSKRENQRFWFDRQLNLAADIDVPVTIHTRDAMADTIDILKANTKNRGIIHCYSGSKESAKILLDMGYYISFAGPLTFKNANTALEVAAYVPEDRILIETDSPYLAPVPYRGKTNCPIYVSEVAKCLARIRGASYEDIARITYENALRAYGIE